MKKGVKRGVRERAANKTQKRTTKAARTTREQATTISI
jgi:hypothetical protein